MKNNAIMEFRGDLRQVVQVLTYLEAKGERPRSRSEVIRSAIALLSGILEENNHPIPSLTEAIDIWTSHFSTLPARKPEALRALAQEMSSDFLEKGVVDDVPEPPRERLEELLSFVPKSNKGEEGE